VLTERGVRRTEAVEQRATLQDICPRASGRSLLGAQRIGPPLLHGEALTALEARVQCVVVGTRREHELVLQRLQRGRRPSAGAAVACQQFRVMGDLISEQAGLGIGHGLEDLSVGVPGGVDGQGQPVDLVGLDLQGPNGRDTGQEQQGPERIGGAAQAGDDRPAFGRPATALVNHRRSRRSQYGTRRSPAGSWSPGPAGVGSLPCLDHFLTIP